ncbi:hypothetical protein ABPG74_022596 [Tetrahymena malaccensis]
MSMSDSEIEEGLKKVSLAHEGYNIPTSGFKQDIEKFYDDIHTNIEELNQKLIGLFKKKEDDLCNMYKREMTKAQKRLRELQECTSEQELNKRKIEKKEKLQRERQKFLETSIYFSNQCKEFKNTLTKVVNTTKDLEAEINFLNEQIVFADRHNQKLQNELEQLKDEIHKFDPNAKLDNLEDVLSLPPKQKLFGEQDDFKNQSSIQQNNNKQSQSIVNNNSISVNQNNNNVSIQGNNQTSIMTSEQQQQQLQGSTMLQNNTGFNASRIQGVGKYVSPYSKRQIMKPGGNIDQTDLEKAKQELKRQKEINEKLTEFLNDPCFQETEFEKIFMECVLSVKQKKLQQTQANKLPYVKSKDQPSNQDVTNPSGFKTADSTLDFTTISELDFNEFNKRQILEEFLSKEEIKKYLYTLIFSNNNNNSNPPTSKSKPQQKESSSRKAPQNKQSNQANDFEEGNNILLDELKK